VITDWTEYHRNYHYIRRQRIWDYLGGKCVRCGRTDNLEVDHIDRTKKSFNISRNMTLNDEVRAELDKCQLLCADHHHEKTAQENTRYVHGATRMWMKKKCRCDVCLEAQRAWYDARNERRRGKPGGIRGPYNLPAECGTNKKYWRGCHCDACRAAHAAYERDRKAAKEK
jgi:hypothetical protein